MHSLYKEEEKRLIDKTWRIARIPRVFSIASIKSPSEKLESYYKKAEMVVHESLVSGDVEPVNGKWPQRGIFMVGPKRSGKSFLAVVILQNLMVKHRTYGLFLNVSDLFHHLKMSMSMNNNEPGFNSGRKLIEKAIDVEFLILDDLASVAPNAWVLETFYNILDQRWANLKFTIIGWQIIRMLCHRICELHSSEYQEE